MPERIFPNNLQLNCITDSMYKQEVHRIMVRCYLRLAIWQNKMQGALEYYENATGLAPVRLRELQSGTRANFGEY